jgi:hypothetical protein
MCVDALARRRLARLSSRAIMILAAIAAIYYQARAAENTKCILNV